MALTDEHRPGSAGKPRDARDEPMATMTLYEHLAELRTRLIVCIIAVLVATVGAWFLYDVLIRFMIHPYHSFLVHHHSKDITAGGNLVTSGPLEGFTTRLRVSAYAGMALAAPVWLWQLWRFITPGLYKHEKRYIVPFVAAATGLFALGVTTAVLVFPKALTWLIDVSGPNVVPLFSPSRYFTLYVTMCLIFGAVFMYPLVVVFLEIVGVVPSARWRRWRRPAIVVIALVAAVITPSSDPFSFLAMAVPMILFYEASIIVGRMLHK